MDLLCVTETLLTPGELSPLSELLTHDYLYFNSLSSLGRGGGLITIYKSNFICKQYPLTVSFPGFELLLFELCYSSITLRSDLLTPVKYSKDFLTDFADFLADVLIVVQTSPW